MSYILDALRRADAERQRGAVPGLHAQPSSAALAAAGPERAGASGRRWWVGGLAALAALALGAGLLWTGGGPSGPSSAVRVGSVPLATPPPSVAAVPLQIAPQPAPQRAEPAPAVRPVAGAVVPPVPVVPVVPVLAAASRAASGALDAAQRLPTLAELPDALRREVQPLSLGGLVYAEQPALRIAIVNGQVFHEGDKPLPDLLVQQIRPKSVVFGFRGQRFELAQ